MRSRLLATVSPLCAIYQRQWSADEIGAVLMRFGIRPGGGVYRMSAAEVEARRLMAVAQQMLGV
jgi:hypothetical protein